MTSERLASENPDLDLKRLRQEFDKIILPSKAKELGVTGDELVVTVRGGRRIFTTRQKVNLDLQRTRTFAAAPKKQEAMKRAIRDGENSVIGDIESRLEDCSRLVDALKQSERMNSLEERDTKVLLKSAADNALRFGTELQRIEEEIEKKKEADPLLSQLDQLARTLQTAKERGDMEAAAKLLEENREALAQYESRRRALEPDIQSALHARLGILREQRRVMKAQLQLYVEWSQVLRKQAQEVVGGSAPREQRMKIMTCAQTLGSECRKAEDLYTFKVPAESSSDKSIRDQNALMEQDTRNFDTAIRSMGENTRHLEELLSQNAPDAKGTHRMVLRERDR
ncbi:MAG TPA: hypothetical protein PK395_06365 [bacterium]|nr:hypothetical protein [bacterium]HQP97012.1 hypothetical protein [bacterium]